jgi:hypothetical protein
MAAYQKHQQATFVTVESTGAILPMDLLRRVADLQNTQLEGLTPDAYHLLTTEKLNEAISRSWSRVLGEWRAFRSIRLPATDGGTRLTRERWLLPLFHELGYGRLTAVKPIVIDQKSYAISHGWQQTPIHLVSAQLNLDQASKGPDSQQRHSPHSLLQGLLNSSEEHLWGIVSNGLVLRILRDNVRLTRQVYVEFDLEAMMDGEIYADFVLLWLLCHQSRFEGEQPEACWLEKWSRLAHEQGIRALDHLRNGVQKAIEELGSGFLVQKANGPLRARLRSGELSPQDYYRQVLRLIYRLLVLFVIEDRDLLFHPDASSLARTFYNLYYSTGRMRDLSERHLGTRHSDLYQVLGLVMDQLGKEKGCPALGLPGLNGFLFSPEAIPDLADCQIANHYLLAAIRWLAFVEVEGTRRVVDYKNLGSEELGSVYEALLELYPVLYIDDCKFELATVSGNERKTTGSYYTPSSLVNCLLDSALDPVLNAACAQPDPEKAILALKVCDPSCGSGHFLIAAAHRIAKKLAAVRTGIEESGPAERRTALRDVVRRCIYGVDINPMAVEICKIGLWIESIEPGKPFSFLDAHIQCGNSLLGATPALLHVGIPDAAFEPIEGDDKKICSEFKKLNKKLREGNQSLFREDHQDEMWEQQGMLLNSMVQLEEMDEDTVWDIHSKEKSFRDLVNSEIYKNALLLANTWCAAFVWQKVTEMRPPITHEEFCDIRKNPLALASWRKAEIERLAQQYQFFHWHLAFIGVFPLSITEWQPENGQADWSDGFDVVLGNPPWERIKIQEKEWFATRRPEIANAANAAARRKMIVELQTSDKELYADFMNDQRQATGESHFVRNSARYPLCGRGDVNTYAIFAEHMRWIVGTKGRLGCIVPSGIATDDTTKLFFQDVIEKSLLMSLYDFENRKKLFRDVDSRYSFCLLTMLGLADPTSKGVDFVFFAHSVDNLREEPRHFVLSARDVALLNPNTKTSSIFRSRHDAELNLVIYKKVPVLINEQIGVNHWFAYYMRLVDLSDHAEYLKFFWEAQHDQDVPLYEAKLFNAFDHRFNTFENVSQEKCIAGQPCELSSENKDNPLLTIHPRYFLPKEFATELFSKYPDYHHSWFLLWRDVARSTDEHTCITTIIPKVVASRTCPALGFNATVTPVALLTNFNSWVFDYIARQKVGGLHLNFSVLKQLPVLPPTYYTQQCTWNTAQTLGDWITPRALELTYTAWDLEAFAKDCGYDGPPFRWDEERRFLLRCELDAAYFHLYGIARDDVDYIMDTFRVWREKEVKQYHEYRTKRVILEIYDEMQAALDSGSPYKTRLLPPPADPKVAHSNRDNHID